MAKWRVADLGEAVTHFSQAIRLDPAFAPAYVELAEAQLRQAEFEVTDDRRERFAVALQRGRELVDHALQLDARNGAAYIERASLKAYTDLADAESDYRHGLELSPNYARGYAGLAAVLYEDPRRRDEALMMLDRARKLDPLEPTHDITKAVFLFYGRSDVAGAEALLTDVLERDPLNQLALVVREIPLYLYAHEWRRAGEAAYAAVDSETNSALDEPAVAAAIRMHARATRDYARAIDALQGLAGVTWDAAGRAVLPESRDLKAFPIALADVLQLSGDDARARSVLEATLAAMDRDSGELGRGDLWYLHQRPIALALLGRNHAAITALRVAVERGVARDEGWYYLEIEPSVARLAGDARFIEMRNTVRASVAEQRRLTELRDAGLVPRRP